MAARSLRQLEAAQQLAQEDLELCDLLWIEPLQELAIAGRIGGNGSVHDLEALVRQLDQQPATIVRIRESTDESSPLESIDPARHARRRQH